MPLEPASCLRVRRLRLQGGPAAIQELIVALDEPECAHYARWALSDLKALEAVPALIRQARMAEDVTLRANCVYTLGELDHPESFPALIDALDDPSPDVSQSAIAALGLLGDDRAVPHLKALLCRPEWEVRKDACGALLELGVADDEVSSAIARLAGEPEAALSGFTVQHLQQSFIEQSEELDEQPEDDPAAEVEKARAELTDERSEVRAHAVRRLQAAGGDAAVTLLLGALNDPAAKVRSTAALALGSLEAPEAVPSLLRLLTDDPSEHVRLMCATAFMWRADPRAFEPLVAALRADDWKLATSACRGLVRLGDARAVPAIVDLLEHPAWSVRLCACEALLELRILDPRVVAALQRLSDEPEAEEHDLSAAESVRDLPSMRELAQEMGDPEPQALPTMPELIERARALLRTAAS